MVPVHSQTLSYFLLGSLAFIAIVSADLDWSNCTDSDPIGLQCAQLSVPLNWTDPSIGNITLGIARLTALDASRRIGNLFFNPGGPASHASTFIQAQASGVTIFSDEIRTQFDLIGLDPRGLGLSSPIQCDYNIWNERVSYFPTTEAEFQIMMEHNKAFGRSCLNLTGPLLGLMDTKSGSHDMEATRIALGDEKLNYLGLSYGTVLGSQYAELYPDNVRTMALDGNTDHSQHETSLFAAESSTAEDEFHRFIDWCTETPACALHGQNITALFSTLITSASTSPIPAPGCVDTGACLSDVTGEDILFKVQAQLIFKTALPVFNNDGGWILFATALYEALNGNATLLSTPTITTPTSDTFGGLAIECLDWTHHTANSPLKVKYKKQLAAYIAPITGGATQSYSAQSGCVGWPVPVANPPRRLWIRNRVPILLVNSEHDPECSYVWANSLMEQIENAVLLTRAGDGHTSYFLQGDTTKAIDDYLVNKTVPATNTVLES